MDRDYWLRQEQDHPLYPDIIWQKPEQKALRGKLLIIGGNAHGFAAVAQAYQDAMAAGAGECRVVLPDALKKVINLSSNPTVADGALFPRLSEPLLAASVPRGHSRIAAQIDCQFVPTNQSGGITKDSLPVLKAAAAWADALLFIGDAGRNSETAIVYEQLLNAFPDKITIITRDTLDLIKNLWPTLLQRPHTVLIASFAQLQKMFQAVYYPKTLLFSMQLTNVVEALHKFSVTYPATVVSFHQNQLIVATNGQISSTPWEDVMLIWRGSVAARASVYAMQQPKQLFQAVTTSFATEG
jgi:hypothetical protein